MAQIVVPWIPLWAYETWVARGVDWLAMSEDLPDDENRVTVQRDGRIRLTYRANNVARARAAGRRLQRMLRSLGFWVVMALLASEQEHDASVRHAVLRQRIPATSVLDPCCRTHDVGNLFVVDASFFPSSAAVNPGLTIAAQALRVAEHITRTELGR